MEKQKEKRPKKTATGQPVDQIDTTPSIKKLEPSSSLPEAVITFGKFNPPHAGHVRLVENVTKLAEEKGAVPLVYVSKGKGLLEYHEKLDLCKKAFGDGVITETTARTVFEVLEQLSETHKHITLVVGTDRYAEFKERVGLYFENVDVVEFERNGHESSTYLRQTAAAADFDSFKSALPASLLGEAEQIFETISYAQKLAAKPKVWHPKNAKTSKPNLGTHAKIAAMNVARNLIRTQMAANSGRYIDNLTPNEKLSLDKMMARRAAFVQKIATRMLPKVKRPEFRALQQLTGMPVPKFSVETVLEILTDVLTERDLIGLDKKARNSGIPSDILDEVFIRGLVSEGTTQAAFQRVSSFIAGNVLEEDLDLQEKKTKAPKTSDKLRFIMFKHNQKEQDVIDGADGA